MPTPLSSSAGFQYVFSGLHAPPVAPVPSIHTGVLKSSHTLVNTPNPPPKPPHLSANVLNTLIIKNGSPISHTFTAANTGLILLKNPRNTTFPSLLSLSKKQPHKTIALARYHTDFSASPTTMIVTSTKKLSALLAESATRTATTNLIAVQLYSAGPSDPSQGVFECNYSCDPSGQTKYTSVSLIDPFPSAPPTAVAATPSATYKPVESWRHETLTLETRKIVAFVERTKAERLNSVTLTYIFNPHTAQPVLLGAGDVVVYGRGETRISDAVEGGFCNNKENSKVKAAEHARKVNSERAKVEVSEKYEEVFETAAEKREREKGRKKERPKERPKSAHPPSRTTHPNPTAHAPPRSPLAKSKTTGDLTRGLTRDLTNTPTTTYGYMATTTTRLQSQQIARGTYASSVTPDNANVNPGYGKTTSSAHFTYPYDPSSTLPQRPKSATLTPANTRNTSPSFPLPPTLPPVSLNTSPPQIMPTHALQCRGSYCNLLPPATATVHDASVPRYIQGRAVALGAAEDKFDELSLMQRYAHMCAAIGGVPVTEDACDALLRDVVADRFRTIVEVCARSGLEMFTQQMGVSGVSVGECEVAARKIMYGGELSGIPPQRLYEMVGVCNSCEKVYQVIEERRGGVFGMGKKGRESRERREALENIVPRKVAGTGVSAARQYRRSVKHSSGVGSNRGLQSLTGQEVKAGSRRRELLERQEEEIRRAEWRVRTARAKKEAMEGMGRREKKKGKARKSGLSFRGEEVEEQMQQQWGQQQQQQQQWGQQQLQMYEEQPQLQQQQQPPVPSASLALVITSGEIGFDGRKFVFKPPSVPRQLALSDVRKAGFVTAEQVQATVETQQRDVVKVVVETRRKPDRESNAATKARPVVDYSADEGVFDLLKTSEKDLLGVSLGLSTNDYLNHDSDGHEFLGFLQESPTKEQPRALGEEHAEAFLEESPGMDASLGLDAGAPVYEAAEAEEAYPRSFAMQSDLDDLRSFKVDLDMMTKKKGGEKEKEVGREIRAENIVKPVAVAAEEAAAAEEKKKEEPYGEPYGEYGDDFEYADDFDAADSQEKEKEEEDEVMKEGEREEQEELEGLEEEKGEEELSLLSDKQGAGDVDYGLDDDDFDDPPLEDTKWLAGFAGDGPGDSVPLGVITGGETYINSSDRGAITAKEGRSLPSGEYLQEIARLKADAAFMQEAPIEIPKTMKKETFSDAELLERMLG